VHFENNKQLLEYQNFILLRDIWGLCYKTNTAVIYCNFRLNYRSNFYNIEFTWNGGKLLWYDGKLMCYFNPRKSRVKVTTVIYRSIFITQAPGGQSLYLHLNAVYFFQHHTILDIYGSLRQLFSCIGI
jgi:hypothetical protein